MKKIIFLTIFAIFLFIDSMHATIIEIKPNIDTYVSATATSTNYGSDYFIYAQNSPEKLAYIKMNLASIPAFAKITKAELVLFGYATSGANTPVSFNQLSSSWGESTVTYSTKPTYTSGGTKSVLLKSTGDFVVIDITDWVQNWYSLPSANNGIRISASSGQSVLFCSSDFTGPNINTPTLKVTYELLPYQTISWTGKTGAFTNTTTSFGTGQGIGSAYSTNSIFPSLDGSFRFNLGNPYPSNATNLKIGFSIANDATNLKYYFKINIFANGTYNLYAMKDNTTVGTFYGSTYSGTECEISRLGNNIVYRVGTSYYTYFGNQADKDLKLVVAANIPTAYTSMMNPGVKFNNYYVAPVSPISYTSVKSNSKNYIRSITPRVPISTIPSGSYLTTEYSEDVQYFDGLGRPVESISLLASPNGNDIITQLGYDNYGRQAYDYLPYTKAENFGAFDEGLNNLYTFYALNNTNGVPVETHTEALTLFKNYEESPLNRLEQTVAPGYDWQGKPVNIVYDNNTLSDNVYKWRLGTDGYPYIDVNNMYYPGNSLFLTQTTDEDNNVSKEFKNNQGQIILKDISGIRTYYVYDDFGLLRFAIPHKATANTSNSSGKLIFPSTIIYELIYQYTYDAKKRMIKKKLPGADEILMVYDSRDRLVLVQDGKLRSNNIYTWMFTKYDILNRPVLTGIETFSNWSHNQLIQLFEPETTRLYESPSPTTEMLYTLNNSYPIALSSISGQDVYSVTYYDSYPSYTSGLSYSQLKSDFDASWSNAVINKVTTTKVRAIPDIQTGFAIPNELTVTNYYYDKYGRNIGNTSLTYLGLTIKSNNKYSFANELVQTQKQILNASTEIISIGQRFVYDHRSRLLESYHKIGNGTEVLLSRNNYNELGQVIEKNTGLSNFAIGYLQSTDYAYNIRGWLSKINSSTLNENENDLFGMELYYQSSTIPGSTNVYNGNISGMVWKNKPSNTTKSYRFGYDNLNRLINANYAEGTNFASNTGYYDETYQYDANGNITLLVRKSNNLEIDRLTYNYYDLGNRLKEIIDGAPAGSKTNGLNDRNTSSSIDYEYDKNGNLLKDYNKQMAINSNYLNLPSKISCTTASITDKIEYLYDAQGNKLAKKVNGAAEEEHYMGDVLIKRTGNTYTVSYLLHSEGVVSNTSSALVYEYFLKDHLGNVRVKYTADANSGTLVQQATDYYPFGLTMTPIVLNNDNKFLYNGKELQENTINNVKLDWYDYGFRMYDPQLGRWHCVDPLAELDFSFSPYNFCLNNPIKLIDPNGLSTHTDSTGAVIAVYDDDDNSVYKHRTLPKSYAQDDAGVEYKEEKDKDGNIKKVPVNKLTGGENMGETEFWNEFISPESGNVMTETTIQFGKSWDPIIDNMAAIADDMDLTQIAANSGGGGLFDIKAKYSNVGGLLNGKYATSRSAGNYLAGYNAQGGSYFGIGISFTIFQKMAGALHEKGTLTDKEKAGIYLKGTSYGPPPAYGEEIYQYRMSKLGWDASKNK